MAITQSRREYDLALGGMRDEGVVTLESTQPPELPGIHPRVDRDESSLLQANPSQSAPSQAIAVRTVRQPQHATELRCGFSRLS
jgi:hypothetical protein